MRFRVAFAAASILVVSHVCLGQGVPEPTAQLAVPVPKVVQSSTRIGHSDPNRLLHVSLSLPVANEAGLQSYADAVSDPKSPNYRKFLTPEEIGVEYGVPLRKLEDVKDYLAASGFRIQLVAKNRLNILADCTVAQAEAAFHTTINDYRALSNAPGNENYFAFSTPLRTPAAVAPYILDVSGLESFTKPQARSTMSATQTRTLYNLASMYAGGLHGEGRNIAISNWDGFRLTNVPLYYTQYGLPAPAGGVGSNITVVAISGGAGGGTAQGEGDLDIQMVLGMAPLCNFTIYDGGSSDLIGVLTREANDNIADVISESWGWSLGASTATAAHNIHLAMTAQGITYMAASGDSGTTLEPYSYPDYDPEVLMVGGSSATVDANGNRTAEVGWNSGGGGWSNNTATFNVLPSWQRATGVPTTINHRLVPDIALHASGTQTSGAGAYYFYRSGSLTGGYLGTSFASPVFAGMLAVCEQKVISLGGLPANGSGQQRFGRIQDLLYSQNMRSDVWLDLTSGANGTLPSGAASTAAVGWDFVTGLGAIDIGAFAATQAGNLPDFTINASPASQTVGRGYATSYTVNTTAINSFSGAIALTVTGLPTGAVATFTPTTITGAGTSTLGITTLATTPTGTYTLTIKGTSGVTVHATTVKLVVNVPDFTISATPSSQTVVQGSPGNYTVNTTAINSFAGAIALTVTGLPTGAAATFTPASITGAGSSALSVTTNSTTPGGTYTLTIKGACGTQSHSANVTLVVNVPDFTIGATPASQTVIRPTAAPYTVTTTSINTFSGPVALTVTGLPSGATATFSPTTISGAGSSTLTVTPGSNTPQGTFTLTIKGTSGTQVHTVAVKLFVNVPDFTVAATPSTQTVVQGSSGTYTVNTTSYYSFSGSIALTVSGLPTGAGASFSPASITGAGSSTLTVTTSGATPGGTYSLTVKGTSGSQNHSATIQLVVKVPDFTIAATPASQTVISGSGASYTVSTTSLYTFSGPVALSVSGLPAGAGATFTPTTIGGAGSSTLAVTTGSNTPAGTFTLTVTGTSGTLTHTTAVKIVVNVPNFTIAATPASQSVVQGSGTSYAISTTSINTFSGSVALSVSGLPAGAGATFTPASITGAGSATMDVTTAVSTPYATYTLTITGTSGAITHTTTVKLVVTSIIPPDFSLTSNPMSQTVARGTGTSYQVGVPSLYGFTGMVAMTITGLPPGAGASFNPASVRGGTSTTLVVNTSSSTAAGTYTLTITGKSGALIHTMTITFIVQ